jgi:hypothetical protein
VPWIEPPADARERDGQESSPRRSAERRADDVAAAAPAPPRPAPDAGEGAPRTEAPAAHRSLLEQVVERLGDIRREGRHQIAMQLEPADLGTVHVEAVLQGGLASLEIRVELAHARDVLQQGLAQLRQSLSEQGIVPDRVTVHLGLDASGGNPSGRGFAGPDRPPFQGSRPGPSGAAADAPARGRSPSAAAFDFWV